ncbi:MAG: threonylcarbamoyl-AMP synthase [candidate division NC10 bacterium]|nr:threonylcarbamoyl-AMP synthase [candidate division NC10 bacterium]
MAKKTRITPVDFMRPDPAVIGEAVAVLRRGGLVAFPTDTLYALGADLFKPEAVARVLEVKKRSQDKPIPVFIGTMEDVNEVARDLPGAAWQLAERFWPGPLTLVLLAAPNIPEAVTAGTGTIGIRIPKSHLTLEILAALDHPITGTSANRSGGVDPVTVADVVRGLGNRCDLILDGGRAPGGIASTVLDCTELPFRIIREGAITAQALGTVLSKGTLRLS